MSYEPWDDDGGREVEPSPTVTRGEAKRRKTCADTALFHLSLAREALMALNADVTDLESLIEDAQEASGYYSTPAEDDEAPCGRIMVGSGTDTYDPTCDLVAGHGGPCKSRSAIDQHRLES